MKIVKQVVAVLVWCGVSSGCVADGIKQPALQNKNTSVDSWGGGEKIQKLLKENKVNIIQSKHFQSGMVCRSVLEDLINEKIEDIKPTNKLDSEESMILYLENKYGCKNFKINHLSHMDNGSVFQYELEPPYLVTDLLENDSKKYFSIYPSKVKQSSINVSIKSNYDNTVLGYVVYYANKKCESISGSMFPDVGTKYEYSYGGILKSKNYGFVFYEVNHFTENTINQFKGVDIRRGRVNLGLLRSNNVMCSALLENVE